jgi:alanine dehydrogenase
MIIGIPKEIKTAEFRVGATPAMVHVLVAAGHKVFVETNAGAAIGFFDEAYKAAGASIASDAQTIYNAELVIKVKEPQPSEIALMHEGLILFCYLHLAPEPELTKALVDKKVIAIAYETVTDIFGRLPLLIPMSEIAGRIAIQVGATALQMNHGGRGVLLGGVPGTPAGKVVIIGGGVVGTEAARMARGLGAEVTILDKDLNRLRHLDALFGPALRTIYSTSDSIEECIVKADLIIGAVLIPGKTAPKLIKKEFFSKMAPGSVFVDVAIDQGGCAETSRPTTHEKPTYIVDGVIHYCVTNMPGACARSSTLALTNATMDYAQKIADLGYQAALKESKGLRDGLNVCLGAVTNAAVAADLGYAFVSPESFY